MRFRDGLFALWLGFSLVVFGDLGFGNYELYAIGIPTVMMVIHINERR